MGRKVIALWLSITKLVCFIVIIVKIAPTAKAPIIIYVDDEPGFGTDNPAENFTNIQDAVDNASEGDTVFVYNGTYYENVVVNKTINLTGESRDMTIIDGGGNNDVVRIEVDWVNITGFTLTGCGITFGSGGIEVISAHNCSIVNNNITRCRWAGIFLDLSTNNKILNNNIYSNSNYGVYIFWYSNNNLLEGNNFSSNYRYGIYIYRSSGINVTGNNFVEDGIYIGGEQLEHFNSHNIPTNNMVNMKSLHYYKDVNDITLDGISVGQLILANCTNVTVKNLQINDTDVGMEFAFSTGLSIKNNTIYSNNDYGLIFWYSPENNITGNNISSNDNDGIHLDQLSDKNKITNNDIVNNNYGIFLYSSSNNYIVNNNVSSNKWYGIYLCYSSYNNVTDNFFDKDGINLKGTILSHYNSHNLPSSNIVNGKSLLYLKNSSGIVIDGMSIGQLIIANCTNLSVKNILIDNTDTGLDVAYSTNVSITKNKLRNNLFGILIDSSSYNNLTCNEVSDNEYGIRFESSSSNNKINYNAVLSNLRHGFYISSSSNNLIYHNNIINNKNQAYDSTNNGNQWDNDYPLGGNYWSDFDEPGEGAYDDFQGQDQNISGSDGKVDNGTMAGGGKNPYFIDGNSMDNYPLVRPYQGCIVLKQGWNLISIPLIQINQNLSKVLEMIDGNYDAVQWYDNTDLNDPWKDHKIDKFPGNDLFKLNETLGFWININQSGDTIFLYNGTQLAANQTILLYPRWNLVGYPSLTSYNRTQGLNNLTFGLEVDAIWTHNPATKEWEEIGPSDYFIPGKGYWIHTVTECQWEVPL